MPCSYCREVSHNITTCPLRTGGQPRPCTGCGGSGQRLIHGPYGAFIGKCYMCHG